MKKFLKDHLKKLLFALAFLILIFIFFGKDINFAIRSKIIELQLEKQLGENISITKLYPCKDFISDIVDEKTDSDRINKVYYFVATIDEQEKKISGYTNFFSSVIYTSSPELSYGEQEKEELKKYVDQIVGDKEYLMEISFSSKMYSKDISSYEDFLATRKNGHWDDELILYFKSDTTISKDDINNIISLIRESEIPIEIIAYQCTDINDRDFNKAKETRGDFYLSYEHDSWKEHYYENLRLYSYKM